MLFFKKKEKNSSNVTTVLMCEICDIFVSFYVKQPFIDNSEAVHLL